jgi:hypothetical protein
MIRVMDGTGDSHIYWDKDDDKSIKNAKTKFKDFLKKGYKAYRVGEDEKKAGWPIKEFPEFAGALVLIPPMAGG